MDDRPGADGTKPLLRRLARLRLRARAALLFERAWPAAWPPLGVLGAFACLALLDLPRRLPAALHLALLAGFAVAFVWTLARAGRAVRLPSDAEADRRLERTSGLHHRPLAVLTDQPALPGAEALWRAHVRRAIAQVGRLRVGLPHPGLAARDRRALRAGLIVALAACLGIAGTEAPSRLARAFLPAFAPGVPAEATEVQGWITPPAYTDEAPVFLHPEGGSVAVPAGSHLTVSLSGGSGTPSLTLAGRSIKFAPIDAASFQADQDLSSGGRLVVRRGGDDLAGWDVTVVADAAPVVRWAEPPGAARGNARVPATRLPWQVQHAYGVVSLQAELHLKDRPSAPALVVPIPLPGGAVRSARGVHVQDLTANPRAGLAVVGRLVARDAPGLTGFSAEAGFVLPERRFDNPVARRLIAVRRDLTLHPEDRPEAIGELEAIAELDQVWHDDAGGFLNLRAIGAELYYSRERDAVADAQSRLWQLALHLEEGGSERTARALAEARRELRALMDAQKRGEKVDPKEIDRRIQALEEAIQKHLDALAEQLREDPDAQIGDPDAQQLNAQDAQKLAELEKMLDALQRARPVHRDAQERRREQQRRRGEQQLSAVQDLVQREGGLLDHAQSRAAEAPPAAAAGAARGQDRLVQQALRRALGELMQQYGDLMGQVPPNLGDADKSMEGAAQALGQGRDAPAGEAEQKAIEALQKGGQAMSAQMQAQFGAGAEGDADDSGPGIQFGDQPGDSYGQGGDRGRPWAGRNGLGRQGDRHLDPLGRPLQEGANGADESDDTVLPEAMEGARTRAIQDELRRRGADRSRPQPELDYIDRLLKQF